MVSALKNAWATFVQAPRHFLLFGFLAYAATLLGEYVPVLPFFLTYFVLPALYISVAIAAESGVYSTWGEKPQLMAVGKGFVHAGSLGMMLLFQLLVGSLLLGFVAALFLDADTAAKLEAIQREAGNDPELLMDMLQNDVDWMRSRFLGLALLILALGMAALSAQAWFIRVFEHQTFFGSLRQSISRGRAQFGTWVLFALLMIAVFALNSALGGASRILTFPLMALTHFFLYKKGAY
ncbi:MAG TPA: hypothetical protein DCE58_06630 [Cryomorphaceae bacterium]|nr:hypothetical protein [Cryomorphaceae bacterium]